MIKNIWYTILFVFACFQVNGQATWAKSLNKSNGNTLNNFIAKDAQGNMITIGGFSGIIDMDPGPSLSSLTATSGGTDIYVSKLDSNGNFIWGKKFGNGNITGVSLGTDHNSNIYIAGMFSSTNDFDPSAATYNLTSVVGSYDNYILKLDSNGNFVYAKKFGNNYNDDLRMMTTDTSGNIYFAGNFFGTVDFDPGAGTVNHTSSSTTTGAPDIFLLKLDTAGAFSFVKILKGTNLKQGRTLSLDQASNIYLGGYYNGTMDMNPGLGVNNFTNIGYAGFLLKLNSVGDYLHAKVFRTNNTCYITDHTTDNDGNIYTTGYFDYDSVDLDPGTSNYWVSRMGNRDAFIVKLDSNGNFVWGRHIADSTANVRIKSISYDGQMGIVLGGEFYRSFKVVNYSSPLNLNPFNPSNPSFEGIVCKMDTAGNYIYSKRAGQLCNDVLSNPDASIHATGLYHLPSDLDLSANIQTFIPTTSVPSPYIIKYSHCSSGIFATESHVGCDSVIAHGVKYTNNGLYYHTLAASNGCDSIIPLDVLIKQRSASSYSITACDSFYFNNSYKFFSSQYKDTFTNAVGCDSVVTLWLTMKHSTSKVLNLHVCVDTTINSITYSSNGIYNQVLTNAAGCDSFLTINLTINDTTATILNTVSCTPVTYNGQFFSSSGSHYFLYTRSNGCDSNLIFNFTLVNPIQQYINQVACNKYTYQGVTFNSSGNYLLHHYTSALGCDSDIYLGLTIYPVDIGVSQVGNTLTALEDTATYQWITCGPYANIAGETNKVFNASQSGYYAVVVTKNGCSDTSNCLTVGALSVNNWDENALIKLYPNPAKDLIYLEGLFTKNEQIDIYNFVGQKLYTQTLKDAVEKLEIDVSQFRSGAYYIRTKGRALKFVIE